MAVPHLQFVFLSTPSGTNLGKHAHIGIRRRECAGVESLLLKGA